MALSDFEDKWKSTIRTITEESKTKGPPENDLWGKLLTEAQGVAGELAKCIDLWEKAEKLIDSGLGKKLAPAITQAEKTTKEIVTFQAAAKAVQANFSVAELLDKELDQFVKDAKAFKTALAKFEKATD